MSYDTGGNRKKPERRESKERAWNKSSDEQPNSRCSTSWKQGCPGRRRQQPPGFRRVGPPPTVGGKRLALEEKPPSKMADMDTPPKCFPPYSTGWSCGVRRPRWWQAANCKENCKSSWEC